MSPDRPAQRSPSDPFRPVLEWRGVSKRFIDGSIERVVLRNASGIVRKGEWVALVGPSGAGKSTLLTLAAGLDRPDRGQVFVLGQSIEGLSDAERAGLRTRSVGLVFQSLNLLPHLSVLDNVLLPRTFGASTTVDAALSALERVGLKDRASGSPAVLSGGERQRVAIARVLAQRPPLVLADEPTGNLDRGMTEVVLQDLGALARDGAAVLVVTHDPAVWSRAHRVLSLVDGALVEGLVSTAASEGSP